ncbi:MAG: hypothetical protein ACREVI_13615 [Steroidobacteraceae bacterium]
MMEAVFGLIGVLVGASLTWIQEAWSDSRTRERHARYLAIRVVCVLDKYVENCADVALDDGLCEGRRNEEGCLEPQVSPPSSPAFSEDLDWKSIDHELMYRLLSLPSEAEAANRMIAGASEHADPPDYEEVFEERQYQYAKLGLTAFALAEEIRKKYGIPSQELGDWNPAEQLTKVKGRVEEQRRKRGQYLAESASSLSGP